MYIYVCNIHNSPVTYLCIKMFIPLSTCFNPTLPHSGRKQTKYSRGLHESCGQSKKNRKNSREGQEVRKLSVRKVRHRFFIMEGFDVHNKLHGNSTIMVAGTMELFPPLETSVSYKNDIGQRGWKSH